MDRKELLKGKNNTTSKEEKIPRVLRNNWSRLNITKVACKYWNNLVINKSFKKISENQPAFAFQHNKKLKELIGSNKTEAEKLKKKTKTKTV